MRMYTSKDGSQLTVCLTEEDHDDDDIMTAIEPVMTVFDKKGCQTIVFVSGNGNLAENTAALLNVANRREMRSDS